MDIPDGRAASALRFLTELAAWTATPWALAPHSVPLAVASVVLLIGLPTVLATPGDKKQVMVAVPGLVTIALVLLQLAAAVIASWAAWPAWLAVPVTLLAAVCLVLEQPRWRALAAVRADPDGSGGTTARGRTEAP
ncbi:hypothetical protein [Peterkaempfera griseoplana]|uniref:hypothetical protein n=1 Tax=Peterkaempfera griseoplana TaxID=66896 RepID=UPI0006E2565A|nr:hypothetical protein [Peterkaempfera griseoplana]